MRLIFVFICCISAHLVVAQATIPQLPVWNKLNETPPASDWLINPAKFTAGVWRSADNKDIILYNGLVKRTFRVQPDAVCYDYKNMISGQQLLRAVKAEARINIDGTDYRIGGLYGQKEHAYLQPEWLDEFSAGTGNFQLTDVGVEELSTSIKWQPGKFWSTSYRPATGKTLTLIFHNKQIPALQGVEVAVHYSLYDNIPLIVKWLTVKNGTGKSLKLNQVVNEILALVEEESAVVGSPDQMKKQHGIYVETNYAFNNAMRYDISDQTTHWKTDSSYTSQVNYNFETPCLLEIYPEKVSGVDLTPGDVFTSVRTHELLMDSYDRERRGLAIRKMYRTVAPWTMSNPIFMHLVSKSDKEVYTAIDQCAATGYEAVILSFGSHLNMEDSAETNMQSWKKIADYAHAKNIKIGGYSLFSSRRINDETDVIDPKTNKPGGAFFGHAPCFGSVWGLNYRDQIKRFYTVTGFDIWENDGPYPGDVCASTQHPGHKGLEDSQWRQMEIQKELYRWLNEQGVYINAPDWYFLDGTHKIAIGYREVNFSLPRENQRILNRQNIYDGTWEKTPAMGWGFVPLTRYQGGGPEAILEPLDEHLKDYKQLMVQYYGAGVQACYRGPRLYDTENTRTMVAGVINWYKKYRDILNADIIHLRRPDARDWDGILHVSPNSKVKGFVVLYNPLKQTIKRQIQLPLYYTGLRKTASVSNEEKPKKQYVLDEKQQIRLDISLAPESYTWYTIE